MLKFLRRDLALKLASLALSIIMFLYVQSQSALVERNQFDFTLEPINLNDNEMVITAMSSKRLVVTAEGPPEELRRIDRKRLTAYIDLQNAEPGNKSYPVRPVYPADIKVNWQRPSEGVTVTIERMVSDLKPVTVIQSDLSAPTGFALGKATVEPQMVRIECAESKLKEVGQVRSILQTKEGEPVQPGQVYEAKVEALGKDGTPLLGVTVYPSQVKIHPTLSPQVPRHTLLVSPVWQGAPAFGYRVSSYEIRPIQIEVTGDSRVLASTSVVRTRPVDIEGLKASTSKETSLVIPSGMTYKGARRVMVVVRIEVDPTAKKPETPLNP